MTQWLHHVDLSDVWSVDWDVGDTAFSEWLKNFVIRLRSYLCFNDMRFVQIIEELEQATDLDEFDNAWGDLYDYADTKRIWIKTH